MKDSTELEYLACINDLLDYQEISKTTESYYELFFNAQQAAIECTLISFTVSEIGLLQNIADLLLKISFNNNEEILKKIKAIKAASENFESVISILTDISFYGFKYKKDFDFNSIFALIDFFRNLRSVQYLRKTTTPIDKISLEPSSK